MEAEDPRTAPDGRAAAPPDRPQPVQETLPFAADDPIPFALTARARRVVAPDSLPSLRVLGAPDRRPQDRALHDVAPVDLDDPHDTRPSRARALRRAGVDLADIARELDVDDLVVRAWVDEVTPVRSARRRLRAVEQGSDTASRERSARRVVEQRRAEERFERVRREACDAAGERLGDATFSTGLGLVAGILDVGPHAAVVTVRRRALGGAVVRWLTGVAGVPPQRMRVLLRIAPQAPADVAAHAWAQTLGLPAERISYTRWRAAPDAEAEEATIRIADADASARLAGWRDALLRSVGGEPPRPPATS